MSGVCKEERGDKPNYANFKGNSESSGESAAERWKINYKMILFVGVAVLLSSYTAFYCATICQSQWEALPSPCGAHGGRGCGKKLPYNFVFGFF